MRKIDLNQPEPKTAEPAVESATKRSKDATPTQTAVDSNSPVHDNQTLPMKKLLKPLAIFAIIAVIAGVSTGFAANRLLNSEDTGVPSDGSIQRVADDDVTEGEVFGSPDEKAFKDSAEGYLEAGGLDGEGSHRLLRPGGEAQTVYLTSSVTDLDKLVGMEVKVWGETFKGQKAGWLMDVGRVKVVKVDGESPLVE